MSETPFGAPAPKRSVEMIPLMSILPSTVPHLSVFIRLPAICYTQVTRGFNNPHLMSFSVPAICQSDSDLGEVQIIIASESVARSDIVRGSRWKHGRE